MSEGIFSWGEVFEQDLFAEFGRQTTLAIEKVIEEIKDSAAPGLAERCNVQGNLAKEDAEVSYNSYVIWLSAQYLVLDRLECHDTSRTRSIAEGAKRDLALPVTTRPRAVARCVYCKYSS